MGLLVQNVNKKYYLASSEPVNDFLFENITIWGQVASLFGVEVKQHFCFSYDFE